MTAAVRINPPPSATVWVLIAAPTNYTLLAQRPHGLFVAAAGTVTFTDGTTSITLGPGLHLFSPLNITAVTGTVHALFQG